MPTDTTDTTTTDRPEQLWTILQAAEFLCVSDDTARPLLEDVAMHLSARTVRYDPRDVWALAQTRKGGKRKATTTGPANKPKPFTPSGGVVRRTTTKKTEES